MGVTQEDIMPCQLISHSYDSATNAKSTYISCMFLFGIKMARNKTSWDKKGILVMSIQNILHMKCR